MSTIILSLLIGWALGRYWDQVLAFVKEKRHTIQTNKSGSDTTGSPGS